MILEETKVVRTSQELQMLSSVTPDSQVTMIVMNSCSQLSLSLLLLLSLSLYLSLSLSFLVTDQPVMFPHHSIQKLKRLQISKVALCKSKVKATMGQ